MIHFWAPADSLFAQFELPSVIIEVNRAISAPSNNSHLQNQM